MKDGGYQTEVNKENEKAQLQEEINKLTAQKAKLSVDIATVCKAYQDELDVQYAKKEKELASVYEERVRELQKLIDENRSLEAELKRKDSDLRQLSESLAKTQAFTEEIRAQLDKDLRLFHDQRFSFENDVIDIRKGLEEKSIYLKEKEAAIEALQDQYKGSVLAVYEVEQGLKRREAAIQQQADDVAALHEENKRIAIAAAEQSAAADEKWKETERMTVAVLSEMASARDMSEKAKTMLAEVMAETEKVKKQQDDLSSWRDKLAEKEKELSEKQEYLVLQQRKLDSSIRILKELREGGK